MASRAKHGVKRTAVAPDSTREDKIKRRAHEIYYAERGIEPGYDVEDWLQAERELTTDKSMASA